MDPTAFLILVLSLLLAPSATAQQSPSSSRGPTPTSTTPTPSASSSPDTSVHTQFDATFACLGAILILSSLLLAAFGRRWPRTATFLVGFWSFTLVVGTVLIQVKVVQELPDNLPSSSTRGIYLLASLVCGIFAGACCVFWRRECQWFAGIVGGFVFGLFLLALKNGGLISALGLRYVLLSVISVAGFLGGVVVPRALNAIVTTSVVAVGATVFIIGIDCFSRAGLKEFYAYNLGFSALFPNIDKFRLSTGMQIELVALASIFIGATAYQLRRYRHEIFNGDELDHEAKERGREDEEFKRRSKSTNLDLSEWEKRYGSSPTPSSPLIGSSDVLPPPATTPPVSGNESNIFLGALDFEPDHNNPRLRQPNPTSPPLKAARPHTFSGTINPSRLPTRPVSLALPRQLLAPVGHQSNPTPLSSPPPANITGDTSQRDLRRHTLIDLNSDSGIPEEQRKEQIIWNQKRKSLGLDKIVLGVAAGAGAAREGSREKRDSVIPREKERPKSRIMDFSELEDKHKKRLSMIQSSAQTRLPAAQSPRSPPSSPKSPSPTTNLRPHSRILLEEKKRWSLFSARNGLSAPNQEPLLPISSAPGSTGEGSPTKTTRSMLVAPERTRKNDWLEY